MTAVNHVSSETGMVPNCDPYLEIWPPAFRTYNLMVPNLLNLPAPVLGVGGPPAAADFRPPRLSRSSPGYQ